MPIQLIITGDHITDVFAEISNFASAIGGQPAKNAVGETKPQTVSTASAPSTQAPAKSASTEAPATGGKTKALSREEQDAAVEAMIEAGEKNALFDQLTKGRQKAVEDGITAKETASAAGATDDDLEDMFGEGDDAPEAAPVVTADTIRDMMGKLGKDEDGNAIQDNLVKIRDILTRFVTKGKEIKVGNIPAEKLPAVYAELKKLEA